MRFLIPAETENIDQNSPIVWTGRSPDPAFVFKLDGKETGFVGFFLWQGRNVSIPKIVFDQGAGFNEQTALSLKAFRFAFYHVALDKLRDLEGIRFALGGDPTTFRFLALQTGNAAVVAIFHYLFNLRLQKIGVVAPEKAGHKGVVPWISSNLTRIAKFFRDVSAGQGIRVQEGSEEVLPQLRLFLSLEANAVQSAMDAAVPQRTDGPLISFISPTFNTRTTYLTDLVQSFTAEKASYAELILSDDGSTDRQTLDHLERASAELGIAVIFNKVNAGIAAATNEGLKTARGEWIAFIDHDDQFASGAIAIIAQAILNHPEADFFYTDEIIADAALRPTGSFCKPAFDSILLSGVNYINHFSVFRRARLEALKGLRTDREGSQDYDLLLRYLADVKPGTAIHIPFLAYVWRREEGTYSTLHAERSVKNAREALRSVYASPGRSIEILPALDRTLHRVQIPCEGAKPKISVVIPNKDNLRLISRVVGDLRTKTDYERLEIVIVDNGTTDPAVLSFYEDVARDAAVISDIMEEPFNFSRMCNRGASLATGDCLLFLNNDIEVRQPGWLAELVDCLAFKSVGIVGAKLLYPNGSVQHNGVIVGLGGAAGHWYVGEPPAEPGPMNRFAVRQTLTAVTGACMLVTRACFAAVEGFDAETFPIAFNDIDLCLRARAAGFRTVWTPFASLIHHESASRGLDETGTNAKRLSDDIAKLQGRHGTDGFIDDAYSPFYDRRYSKPHLAIPSGLPSPRPNLFS